MGTLGSLHEATGIGPGLVKNNTTRDSNPKVIYNIYNIYTVYTLYTTRTGHWEWQSRWCYAIFKNSDRSLKCINLVHVHRSRVPVVQTCHHSFFDLDRLGVQLFFFDSGWLRRPPRRQDDRGRGGSRRRREDRSEEKA